jgi:class 3 adenylate cyclase/predicted ATPase
MRCPNCGFDNPEEMKFCGECGTPLQLQRRCARCGSENPPRFKFCGACGTPLIGQPRASPPTPAHEQRDTKAAQPLQVAPPSAERLRPVAERRQLTVLFCDLVDSTPLATHLDPEELREVVQAYQRVCAEVIQRFEGYIAQYLGDGLLVYFGYPQAHEDDGHRAARAALGMIEAMGRLNQHLEQERGVRLAVRVGIHTGLVVVGEMGGGGRQEQLALGETPNVAARLQGLAAPDTVVISAATQRLIQGLFTCQDLGLHTLRGVVTPMQVFHVLRESEAQSRLDVAVSRGLTPLVGREQEVRLLLERWAQVKDGHGQVVLLSGEAGIGKSRLVELVKERVAGELHTRFEWRGSPYYQQSPLYPVIAHLHRLLRWHQEESSQERLRKLEKVMRQSGFSLPDVVPLLASLLALPLPDSYPPLALTPERQKQKTLEALLVWLLREVERQPVLLIIEDLHWLDASTLEFLNLLVDQVATTHLFMLLTFRPTFRPPWPLRAHLTHLTLSRLPRHQAALLIEQVAGGKALPAEVHQQLLTSTDGVPLFVEELTKMVLESGLLREAHDRYELIGPLPALAIPATLQDSLMARLDRLETGKLVAQLGATIGRRFSYELLQAVSPVDEATLQQGLGRLVESELLYQRGLPPQATYLFKHALIQEAAQQSLLKYTRQQYHQHIAQALSERFPETVETQPELLAHHYTEAGLAAQAVPYWQRAGQRAIERSANIEAISHLTKGLEALKTLPETPERHQQELTLQLTLASPLLMIKGHTAPEVEQAYSRAQMLCEQTEDTPQRFSALVGLWRFQLNRGRIWTARELGERLLELARRVQDPAFLLQAHFTLGAALFHLGELTVALAHLEQGITFYDPQKHQSHAFLYGGTDSGVACLSYAAWTQWHLGYPDQALRRIHEALTLAQQLSHAYTLSYALHFAAMLHRGRREAQLVRERSEAAIALASEQGFIRWLGGAMIRRGWAQAELGAAEEGIAQIHQGLAAWQAMGTELALPHHLAMLAEAYSKGGRTQEGLGVLAEALEVVQKNGECHYEAELYRLKGELLLQQVIERASAEPTTSVLKQVTSTGAPHAFHLHMEAERCFLQAIDIARQQGAKSLELRAVMSLSRLWQQQGRRPEARQMLAGIYEWFTEGFDTPDLREAKALLETLP